ncbi:MAG: hypothetical protein HY868_06390 [Chloroflexi bacterium]|nr:hypothetical protein [Chloroflexota bacterium]
MAKPAATFCSGRFLFFGFYVVQGCLGLGTPIYPNQMIGVAMMQDRRQIDKMLDEVLDRLCQCEWIAVIAKRYPYCRLTLQIQDGKVVHTDLNLSYKPNSHQTDK